MAICERCGRALALRESGRDAGAPLTVTEMLLDCLNYAYATAQSKGAAEVELIHLLHAIAVRHAGGVAETPERGDWRALRSRLEDLMNAEATAVKRAMMAPKTSAEVRRVLEAASEYALGLGREAADVPEVLRALMTLAPDTEASRLLASSPVAASEVTEQPGVPRRMRVESSGSTAGYMATTSRQLRPIESISGPASAAPLSQHRPSDRSHDHHVNAQSSGYRDGWATAPLRMASPTGTSMEHLLPLLMQRIESLERALLTGSSGNTSSNAPSKHDQPAALEATASLERAIRELSDKVELALSQRAAASNLQSSERGDSSGSSTAPAHRRRSALRSARVRSTHSQSRRAWSRSARTRRSRRAYPRRRWSAWRRYLLDRGWQAVSQSRDRATANTMRRSSASWRKGIRRMPWMRATRGGRAGSSIADRSAARDTQEPDEGEEATKEKRFYLSLEDDVVDAPSIGPRTAERIHPAGISTVLDLLACDPEEAAEAIKVRYITAPVIRDWQDQARLVCTVPWLRGTHAQLLVGAGYRDAETIAAADPSDLMSAVLQFATSKEGQRILRSGPPPDLEKIVKWVRHAGEAELDRAA